MTEEVRNLHEETPSPAGETQLQSQRPQEADVGQALEQVIRLAEDLQSELSPNITLDTPPRLHGPACAPGTEWRRAHHGLFSHLFRWQPTGPAQPSMQDVPTPWQDYARKFEEV